MLKVSDTGRTESFAWLLLAELSVGTTYLQIHVV